MRRFGVFFIDTKNMKGWIFGSERDAQWTEAIGRYKSRFQNPIRQNLKHTKALVSAFPVPPQTVHSVIAFVGDTKLRAEVPACVTQGGGFIGYVKRFDARDDPRLRAAGVLLHRLGNRRFIDRPLAAGLP